MKRFVSLFLLFSYLLSSPGLVYSMHFCGQQLTSVTVAQDGDTNCCCQDAGKPAGRCCHDQKVSSALKDIKLSAAHFKLQAPEAVPAPAVLRLVWQLAQVIYPADEPAAQLLAHAAPPPECPAYVRGHAFLV
ncbi:HYC_CC_PP family protein [Hymenobacter ruber]